MHCVIILWRCEEEYEDSQQVLEIASGAFRYCESLKEIAFSGCQSIQKLVLHKDVLAIERYAFHNCSSLAKISYTGRSGLCTIGSSAFYNCESLLELLIPESVQSIGLYAFKGCSKLKKVVFEFGSKVTALEYCFGSCPELEYVELPHKLTDLQEPFSSSNSNSSAS